LLNLRSLISSTSTPDPHHGRSLQLAPDTNGRVGHTFKRGAPAPIPDAPRKIIAYSQIYPAGRAGSDQSPQAIREDQGIKSCRARCLMPVGGGTAGVGVAQLSIPWKILTPGKPRTQDRILIMARILIRILILAQILTGIPIPARILARITSVQTLTKILLLARILTGIIMLTRNPARILMPSRIITRIPILARILIRIPVWDRNLGPEEILIWMKCQCPREP